MRLSSCTTICVAFWLLAHTQQATTQEVCGNGNMIAPEECDDGGFISGDGCSSVCKLENRTKYICRQILVTGKNLTQCCVALINPITKQRVCNCDNQILSTKLYYVHAKTCEIRDVDECSERNGDCADGAICVNFDGRLLQNGQAGSKCTCPMGFYGTGYTPCTDSVFEFVFRLNVTNLTIPGNWLAETWFQQNIYSFIYQNYARESLYLHSVSARRLMGSEVVVTLELTDWDILDTIATDNNAYAIAQFLGGNVTRLNLISVLQGTSTSVDTPGANTQSPGFVRIDEPFFASGMWNFKFRYFIPEGFSAIFTVSYRYDTSQHPCASHFDVCCIYDARRTYLVGDFQNVIETSLAPCAAGSIPVLTAGPTQSTAQNSNVFSTTQSKIMLDDGVEMHIQLAQSDIENIFSDVATTSIYQFAIGMLFIKNGIVTINMHPFQVQSVNEIPFAITTKQRTGFLDYVQLSLFEVFTRYNLMFIRASFELQAGITALPHEVVSLTDIHVAAADDASSIDQWYNPCYSSLNQSLVDNSGYFDSIVSRTLYSNKCLQGLVSVCKVESMASGIHWIDIPIQMLAVQRKQIYVRMIVHAQNTNTSFSNRLVATQINAQLDTRYAIRTCALPVSSAFDVNDFISVSIVIGLQMEPVVGDMRLQVVVTDIANDANYISNVLETNSLYKAVSLLDSILTVAILGDPDYFSNNPSQSVMFDHVFMLHIQSDDKYSEIMELFAQNNAYMQATNQYGIHSIILTQALLSVCIPTSVCFMSQPVFNRVVQTESAHITKNDATDISWLVRRFGESTFLREKGLIFTRELYQSMRLDGRSRKGLWLLPSNTWPSNVASDHTIVMVAYSATR